MSKKGIEMPMSFIIFLVILVILFIVLLIWNFNGFKFLNSSTDAINKNVIENISKGKISMGG